MTSDWTAMEAHIGRVTQMPLVWIVLLSCIAALVWAAWRPVGARHTRKRKATTKQQGKVFQVHANTRSNAMGAPTANGQYIPDPGAAWDDPFPGSASPTAQEKQVKLARLRQYIQTNTRPYVGIFVLSAFVYFLFARYLPFAKQLNLAAVTVIAIVISIRLWRFNRWENEGHYMIPFLISLSTLAAQLFLENAMVFAVSVSDKNKLQYQAPLQDNVELLLQRLFDISPVFEWFIRKLALFEVMQSLLWILALVLSVMWKQLPYSGLGIMRRFCYTIALSRQIRVLSFLVTVVPSPKPWCYLHRFPAPPTDWKSFLRIAFSEVRGNGGCNDLVFSGHATFWVMPVLIYTDYYRPRNPYLRNVIISLLWFLVVHTSLMDIADKQHYSVDMVLGVIVTVLVWKYLEWVYPPNKPLVFVQNGSRVPIVFTAIIMSCLLVLPLILATSGA